VVCGAYGTPYRLRVEAELRRRGWLEARSPAEASVLAVCGRPGAELAAAIEVVWADMAVPRARVEVGESVSDDLDRAVALLSDGPAQRRDAAERAGWDPSADLHDMPMDHGEMDHGDMGDMGGHMHHHMGNPGGLAMADRGEDRDGLKLDQLHIPLGPILVDWPTGLVVDTVMQGDVIQEATVRTHDPDPYWTSDLTTRGEAARRRAVRHLDALHRLLNLAGWPAAARQAADLRDRAFDGARPQDLDVARFANRVRRSRILRWMLPAEVRDRTRGRLDDLEAALTEFDDPSPYEAEPREVPAVHLEGRELAEARLIVASLDG
ncbi:MAG: hypothetical protein HOY71_47275, partial [Nonomuraea sp.]|nr:hypothetical protein [Nonomuraea sp.]